jgi:hypothetical protein
MPNSHRCRFIPPGLYINHWISINFQLTVWVFILWETSTPYTSQEIANILCHQENYCLIHTTSPLVPLLSQINPAIFFPFNCFKFYLYIRSSIHRSSKWSVSLCTKKILYVFICSPLRATCCAHPILDLITRIMFGRSLNYKAARIVFSTLLLLPSSEVQISHVSSPFAKTTSLYFYFGERQQVHNSTIFVLFV